jgi:hypothetical protein
MKKFLLILAFFVGCVFAMFFALWAINMVGYALSPLKGQGMPCMAYFPKWTFFFSLLVLLGLKRDVRETVSKILALSDNELE